MYKPIIALILTLSFMSITQDAFAASNANPVVKTFASNLDFATVHAKAVNFIKSKNLTVFAEFDHAKNAKDVDLDLPPTTVIVFGSPAVGTKLMQQFPGMGMVLPLKILISQDTTGKVTLSYEDLATIFAPYGVKKDNPILLKMQGLLEALAKNATK